MARPRKTAAKKDSTDNYLDRIETEIKSNQSTLSLVLGILIVLVLGVLLFNYFNKDRSQNQDITEQAAQTDQSNDVSPDSLPGEYTVKEGDTLYSVAEKYYKDGFKYSEIVKTNKLANENAIVVGQVLEIPKLETAVTEASPSPEVSDMAEASPTPAPENEAPAIGGGSTTIWGPRIEDASYTVVEGDWLSTIAARAYGDIMAYPKIAQANNIANPDLIEPGMILKLPR